MAEQESEGGRRGAIRSDYGAETITVLEGLEAVRKAARNVHRRHRRARAAPPGLRGGRQLDRRGDGRLLPRTSAVTLHIDGTVTVDDDGRGIPVEIHAEGRHLRRRGGAHQAARRRQVRQRRVQGVRRLARRRRLGGERAVGNARGGDQARRQGLRAALPPRQARGAAGGGRHVDADRDEGDLHSPMPTIFERTDFSFDILSQRLRELAFLNRGVRIVIEEQATEKRHEFLYKRRHRGVRPPSEPRQDADPCAP